MRDFGGASLDADTMETEELPRRKWSGKRVILFALPLLLLLCAIITAFQYVVPGNQEKQNPETLETAYVKLPDMFVNLSSGPGRARFLKLAVTLEVKGEDRAAVIKKKMPRIVDSFQIYLRELRIEDLTGSAGVFLLKEELLRRVNTELAPDRVEDVLFAEMMTHEQ